MGKYYLTVRHKKVKPGASRIEHFWTHTLRYGRTALAQLIVTDVAPNATQTWMHNNNGKITQIAFYAEASKNKIVAIRDIS